MRDTLEWATPCLHLCPTPLMPCLPTDPPGFYLPPASLSCSVACLFFCELISDADTRAEEARLKSSERWSFRPAVRALF